MKLLIEAPTWLGDAVMASPAIENLIGSFPKSEVTIIGSKASVDLFKNHPNISNLFTLEKNYSHLYKFAKNLGHFDYFFSFRSSFRSRFFMRLIHSNKKHHYSKNKYTDIHQVEKYINFIDESLNLKSTNSELFIYRENEFKSSRILFNNSLPYLGLNPGASYGGSKQWGSDKFAEVAINLSKDFNILIFGANNDINLSKDIEEILLKKGVSNYINLAGKTTITELIEFISILDLFITGDSGPMHIAAYLKIKTISIFGPTNHVETSQWRNEKSRIIRKNLNCQPCMKRECPLVHNDCMRLILAEDVINEARSLVGV